MLAVWVASITSHVGNTAHLRLDGKLLLDGSYSQIGVFISGIRLEVDHSTQFPPFAAA